MRRKKEKGLHIKTPEFHVLQNTKKSEPRKPQEFLEFTSSLSPNNVENN